MPYVAVQANAGLTADCTVLDIEPETGNLLQTRPAIGGNILATIKTPNHRPQMATVRPRSTKPAPKIAGRVDSLAEEKDRSLPVAARLRGRIQRRESPGGIAGQSRAARQLRQERRRARHPGCGRGCDGGAGDQEGREHPAGAEARRRLVTALGATRDVVDRGWLSYPHQIGLSGKTVTPKLYVGVGASGSIQHLAGMQTSENIVAINNDPDAQIFRVADIGIVGDLFEVVPVLTKKIEAAKGR